MTLHYVPNPDNNSIYEKHCAWAKKYTAATLNNRTFHNECDPEKELRIGYVSPDFRAHSVAYFLEPILANHDKKSIRIYCYSAVVSPDETTERFKDLTHSWKSIVGLSDDDVASCIFNDQIDILVDLAGHTGNNRLLIFSRKLAPVQVSYLGYPNTTGLSTIDYRLTDAFADPPGSTDEWYTEKLVRVDPTTWCYRPSFRTPEIDKLPVLKKGHITFGSFNAFYKLNEIVFALWEKFLRELPTSQLFLKSRSLADPVIREKIFERFQASGISQERITLNQRESSHQRHLERYHEVDIALDSFPYNGTTTTCEALYMGVPVITLEGKDHRSRVGVSLLNQVQLQHLIARNEEEYVEIACSLASKVADLAELRNNLRARMEASPLMDEAGFTQGLENTYREMWQKWCNNQ